MANYKQILYYLKMFGRLHDVTKSIKLVAFTKFKKIQYRIKMYNDSLISIKKFVNLTGNFMLNLKHYLIVPLTSDKGCCGSINTHLMSSLESYLNILYSTNKRVNIALIGKKGLLFVKQRYKQEYIRYLQDLFNTSLSLISVVKIIEEILKLVFDKCIFLFNHFNNITEQKVYYFDVLSAKNILIHMQENVNNLSISNIFWSTIYLKHVFNNNIFNDLYSFFFTVILLHSLLDHEISELGGRITSMEKSSQNALEMHDSLQIQYNKARQSYITNQLVEICSASIAINSVRQDSTLINII